MSKKAFIINLVLSILVTLSVSILLFINDKTSNTGGFPFGFTSFNFLGSETDYLMLLLDVIFWFVILLGIWKLIQRLRS